MTALEALNWHQNAAEASDETILAQRRRFDLVEKRPAPLEMTHEEILDWLDENCEMAVSNRATPQHGGSFVLYCDGARTVAPTLREAVCLAAAKLEEANS